MTDETRALVLSAAGAFIIGLAGLVTAIWTGSGAILLDCGFNLVYFATGAP